LKLLLWRLLPLGVVPGLRPVLALVLAWRLLPAPGRVLLLPLVPALE
jgi:hypothetical protein